MPICLLIVAGHASGQCTEDPSTSQLVSDGSANAAERVEFEPGRYFRIEQEGGRYWFVTPAGQAFLSFGVNHITWQGDAAKSSGRRPYQEAVLAKYGTKERWAQSVSEQLKRWGFNTAGAWSVGEVNPYLPRTPILNLTNGYWKQSRKQGQAPDFFADAFEVYVAERARPVSNDVGDPMVLGYFIDNELAWAPDHRFTSELFDGYVALPASAAGKQKFVEFMRHRYPTTEAFNNVWNPKLANWSELLQVSKLSQRNQEIAKDDREAFTLEVSRRYFDVTTRAIRSRDPKRLVLGCRFIPMSVPRVVVQACGEYCDVISVNFYEQLWGAKIFFALNSSHIDRMPQGMDLTSFFQVGKKPVMVTEFTSRLQVAGQNSYPPPYAIQPIVMTQQHRITSYQKQVMSWLAQPWCLGAHWFQHADQPKEGRSGDGENNIFGLVSIHDEPYDEFVKGVTEVNRKATDAHANSTACRIE